MEETVKLQEPVVSNLASAESHVNHNYVPQGEYTIMLCKFTCVKWKEKDTYKCDEPLTMEINQIGFKEGNEMDVEIYAHFSESRSVLVDTKKVVISGEQIICQWQLTKELVQKAKLDGKPGNAQFGFVCKYFHKVYGKSAQKPLVQKRYEMSSGWITLTFDMKVKVMDHMGMPHKNEAVIFGFPGVAIDSKGKTNGAGMYEKKNIDLRFDCRIVFPKNVLIIDKKYFSKQLPYDFLKTQHEWKLSSFDTNEFQVLNYVVWCSDKVGDGTRYVVNPPYFEVVPQTKLLKSRKDIVTVLANTTNTLSADSGSLKKLILLGMPCYQMECEINNLKNIGASILKIATIFKSMEKPKEARISGLSNPLPIKSYNPGVYKFSFSAENVNDDFHVGNKIGSKGNKTKPSNQTTNNKTQITSANVKEKSGSTWSFGNALGLLKSNLGTEVLLTIDDVPLFIDVTKTIQNLIYLCGAFRQIKDLITKNLPAAGCYFDLKFNPMQGEIALSWQNKEHTDHTVYRYVGLEISATFFELSIEIGIGVNISRFIVAQVFVAIEGSLSVTLSAERDKPTCEPSIKVPTDVTFKGEFGGRFTVGYIFQVAATGSSEIKINAFEFSFESEKNLDLTVRSVEWSGLTADVTVSVGKGKLKGIKTAPGEEGEDDPLIKITKTCVEKKTLVNEYSLFGEKKADYLPMDTDSIANTIDEVFSMDPVINTLNKNGQVVTSSKECAQQCAEILTGIKKFDRTESTIKAVAFDIKSMLLDEAVIVAENDEIGINHKKFKKQYKQIVKKAAQNAPEIVQKVSQSQIQSQPNDLEEQTDEDKILQAQQLVNQSEVEVDAALEQTQTNAPMTAETSQNIENKLAFAQSLMNQSKEIVNQINTQTSSQLQEQVVPIKSQIQKVQKQSEIVQETVQAQKSNSTKAIEKVKEEVQKLYEQSEAMGKTCNTQIQKTTEDAIQQGKASVAKAMAVAQAKAKTYEYATMKKIQNAGKQFEEMSSDALEKLESFADNSVKSFQSLAKKAGDDFEANAKKAGVEFEKKAQFAAQEFEKTAKESIVSLSNKFEMITTEFQVTAQSTAQQIMDVADNHTAIFVDTAQRGGETIGKQARELGSQIFAMAKKVGQTLKETVQRTTRHTF